MPFLENNLPVTEIPFAILKVLRKTLSHVLLISAVFTLIQLIFIGTDETKFCQYLPKNATYVIVTYLSCKCLVIAVLKAQTQNNKSTHNMATKVVTVLEKNYFGLFALFSPNLIQLLK